MGLGWAMRQAGWRSVKIYEYDSSYFNHCDVSFSNVSELGMINIDASNTECWQAWEEPHDFFKNCSKARGKAVQQFMCLKNHLH